MKTIIQSPTPAADGNPNTPRLWPGTHEWTDDDYELFVLYFSEGSIPEIHHNPCAWDDHFLLAGTPTRPSGPRSFPEKTSATTCPTSIAIPTGSSS